LQPCLQISFYEKALKQDKTYIGTHGTTSLDDLRRLKGVDPNDYEEVKIIP